MSYFPGNFFGGWYGSGYSSLYGAPLAPVASQAAPDPNEPAKASEPLERPSTLIGRGWMPAYSKAPPGGLARYWQQRRFSAIVLAYAVTTAPAMAGTRTIEIADDQGQPDEAAKRKQLAEKQVKPQLDRAIAGAFEMLHFGHWLYEVEWADSPDGLVPRLHSVLPGEAILYRDVYRQFAGFSIGGNRDGFRDKRYACLFVNNAHIDPIFGESRNENCGDEWWRAIQSEENADRTERKASGIQMGLSYPQGASWVDANGKQIFPADIMQTILDAAVRGDGFAFARTYFSKQDCINKPELLDYEPIKIQQFDWGNTGPALLAAIARLDKLERSIMRAWRRPEREAMEAEHGSRADSGTHGAIGTTDTELVHAAICEQFTAQVLNRWEVTKYGGEPMLRAAAAPLSDPQQDFLQKVATTLAQDTATGPDLTQHIDLRGLLDKVELPLLSEEDVAANAAEKAKEDEAKQKQQAEQFKQQNAPQNGNGMNGNKMLDRLAAAVDGRLFEEHVAASGDDEGSWVTINGVHVLIKNGVIVKGPKRLLGKTHAEAKSHKQSEKSKRAAASATAVKSDIQRYSEERNEPKLANGLKDKASGRNALSLRDNEAVDVVVTHEGKIEHGVELKTMVSNKANKITMKGSALERKIAWAKENKAEYHTVVFDDQKVFNAKGEGKHGPESARQIYYKRGAGSFRVNAMHPVASIGELHALMETPNGKLPAAAQAPATWIARRKEMAAK